LRDGRQRLRRFGGRGVRVLVLGQVGLLPEALAAHGAHERLFTGVRAYVDVHRVLVLEAFAAYVAVVQRPFLFGGWMPGRLVVARRRSGTAAAAAAAATTTHTRAADAGTSDRRPGAAAAGRLFRLAVGVV